MSQAHPIVDVHTSMTITLVAAYIWPAALTLAIATVRWRKLRRRLSFLVLGYLLCTGVGALFSHLGFAVYWIRVVPQTAESHMVESLVNASLSVAVFGALLSIWPTLWLAKLLEERNESTAT